MAEYGDLTSIKRKSGVDPNEIEGVSDTTDLEAFISTLNEQASEAVERYTNRDFLDHPDETVQIDGNGRLNSDGNGQLKLPGQPVRSIAEIKINGSVLDPSAYRIKGTGAHDGDTPTNSGIVVRKNAPFPEGWENIEVTFTWGYQNPPAGVRAVVEDLVVDELRAASRNESAEAAESVSMDGFSVTYYTGRIEDQEKHRERLNRYRRLALARS